MQLYYGPYAFPRNACEVSRSMQCRKNDEGKPIEETWQYQVVTTLVSSLTDKVDRQRYFASVGNEIRGATAIPGYDLVLRDDNGLETDLALNRSGARHPPHRTSFSTPGGKSEYAGMRTLVFTMEATYPSLGSIGALVSLSESYRLVGDGSPIIVQAVCQDRIVDQETRGVSPCMGYQSGQAMGYLAFPRIGPFNGAPAPKFPRGFRGFRSEFGAQTPQDRGVISSDFLLTWSYYSESDRPYKF